MTIKISQLAHIIKAETGIDAEIKGNGDALVSKIAKIDEASQDDISFLANPKFKKFLEDCNAGAMILAPQQAQEWSGNAIVMENPYAGFAIVAQQLDTTPKQADGIHRTAVVHPNAKVSESANIGPHVVIENGAVIHENVQIGAGCFVGEGTIIGEDTRLWPNVTIYHGVNVGKRCAVHANTAIGSDGFGYAPHKVDGNQHWLKIPQIGGVSIGDDTEIGSSCSIDRGALEDTIIGKGVIIDNQCHVAHNVEIGDYTAMAGNSGIAGSTTIGNNVIIGGTVAINGHISICDHAVISGRGFVMKTITEPGVYTAGMPATPHKEWQKTGARIRKLTELFDRVKKLEQNSGE